MMGGESAEMINQRMLRPAEIRKINT